MILNKCTHLLTPVMNVLLNKSENFGASPHDVGNITYANAVTASSNCGYALEQILF